MEIGRDTCQEADSVPGTLDKYNCSCTRSNYTWDPSVVVAEVLELHPGLRKELLSVVAERMA